jgi:hypothetical protein
MASSRINLSEMDFDTIKQNLITYMKDQDGPIADYDYEGSAINNVLDVLSYITHMNAVNANLALNETFLDTAQLRESVVSHAKLLGYTPRSRRAAVAKINFTVNGYGTWNQDNGTDLDLTIPKGTEFSTQREGFTETFTLLEATTVSPLLSTWTFTDLPITQGKLVTRQYTFSSKSRERYYLYDLNVDTTTLKVELRAPSSVNFAPPYTESTNIVDIDGTSKVYFLEESREGFYEIKFGDGVTGIKPSNGDIIRLTYLVVGANDVNNAKTFSLVSSINGNTNTSTLISSPASGGAFRETIDSIKYNAPRIFTAQNRAVTTEDYKAILKSQLTNVQSVSVWGGEDNIPPEYGKVFVSIKPKGISTLSDSDKAIVLDTILKPKNVISITPVLIDPNEITVKLEIIFKYNSNITNLSVTALVERVRAALLQYDEKNLQLFGGVFRASNISQIIDASEVSIISNVMAVTMSKKITPVSGVKTSFVVDFNQKLREISTGSKVTSSIFTYLNQACVLKDYYNIPRNECIIQIVNSAGLVVNSNIGIVDVSTGKVTLVEFDPTSIADIDITVKSESSDIKPLRSDFLSIDAVNSVIKGEIDSLTTSGSVDYQTNTTTTSSSGTY